MEDRIRSNVWYSKINPTFSGNQKVKLMAETETPSSEPCITNMPWTMDSARRFMLITNQPFSQNFRESLWICVCEDKK